MDGREEGRTAHVHDRAATEHVVIADVARLEKSARESECRGGAFHRAKLATREDGFDALRYRVKSAAVRLAMRQRKRKGRIVIYL
jgi:hypothetical protein